MDTPPQKSIMVVDDNPSNLRMLEEILQQQGYEVLSFPLGRLALAAVRQNPPALILLDVNMPEMSGYEVRQQLKASEDEEVAGIPIIFLSGLDETEDKVAAFRAGAVDYIAKPFQIEEVQARVKLHLELSDLRRALKQQNQHLEEAVAARTRELAEANKMLANLDRSKSDFLNLISHEFRTPLVGLLGVGELILDEMSSTAEHDELREAFEESRQRILSILDDALLLTHVETTGKDLTAASVLIGAVLGRAIESTAKFAQSRHVVIRALPVGQEMVVGNENLLARAFHSLIETAIKLSKGGETVLLACLGASDPLKITIQSQGTIPDSALAGFFDIFSIGEAITPGGDLGLGPPLAQRILSLFGASVSVANQDRDGMRFTVTLKRAETSGG